MKSKSSVEIDGEVVPIDNQLLFQRLLIVAGREQLELKSSLQYELSSLPAALFDKDGLMRDSGKPALAGAIWKVAGSPDSIVPNEEVYVLDGDLLLMKKIWRKGETFEEKICRSRINKLPIRWLYLMASRQY